MNSYEESNRSLVVILVIVIALLLWASKCEAQEDDPITFIPEVKVLLSEKFLDGTPHVFCFGAFLTERPNDVPLVSIFQAKEVEKAEDCEGQGIGFTFPQGGASYGEQLLLAEVLRFSEFRFAIAIFKHEPPTRFWFHWAVKQVVIPLAGRKT